MKMIYSEKAILNIKHKLEYILKNNDNIYDRDDERYALYNIAQILIVDDIDRKKIEIKVLEYWINQLLFTLVRKGDLVNLKYWTSIFEINNLDILSEQKNSLFSCACYHDMFHIADWLIKQKKKININISNYQRKNPLHRICLSNEKERFKTKIFDLLIENKIKVDFQDKDGNTALNYCIMTNKFNYAIKLIENGARFDLKNNEDKYPLNIVCSNYSPKNFESFIDCLASRKLIEKVDDLIIKKIIFPFNNNLWEDINNNLDKYIKNYDLLIKKYSKIYSNFNWNKLFNELKLEIINEYGKNHSIIFDCCCNNNADLAIHIQTKYNIFLSINNKKSKEYIIKYINNKWYDIIQFIVEFYPDLINNEYIFKYTVENDPLMAFNILFYFEIKEDKENKYSYIKKCFNKDGKEFLKMRTCFRIDNNISQ